MDWLNNPILMAVIGIVPGLFWLLFFLKEDVHPEPRRLIFYTFLIGALISLPVFISQILLQKTFSFISQMGLVLIIGLAFIEEFFKFSGAYLVIRNNPAFNEPIDAMIYVITTALGFATIENIFIAATTTNIAQAATLTSLRFIGATLLHALASALVGYQWAQGINSHRSITKFVFKGIVYATFLHASFNYLILHFKEQNLLYSSLLLILAAFFVFIDFEKLKGKKQNML